MNPQGQFGQTGQDKTQQFLAAVENARPDQLDVQTTTKGDVQMNVVNAVNANGIVSGRKVVDFIWQRMAICAIIIATGCLIAVLVLVIIANAYNINAIQIDAERKATTNKLNEIYSSLGVNSQNDALFAISKDDLIQGEDIKAVSGIITQNFGASALVDVSDTANNFARISDTYKIVSLKLAGGQRIFLYKKASGGDWQLAAYDSLDEANPCGNSSEEEKQLLSKIIYCPEVKEGE